MHSWGGVEQIYKPEIPGNRNTKRLITYDMISEIWKELCNGIFRVVTGSILKQSKMGKGLLRTCHRPVLLRVSIVVMLSELALWCGDSLGVGTDAVRVVTNY